MPLARDDSPPDTGTPALTVAAVARRLGVAPATLRTWDRRYGLGPSSHLAGSHRRYSSDDVARLVVMRRLTLDGVAPSEAARAARDADGPELARLEAESGPAGARIMGHPSSLRLEMPWTEHPTTTTIAGPVSPTDVVDAALRHDDIGCRQALAAGDTDDVERWWTDLVAPSRTALAARTVLARAGEDPQEVLDAAVLAVLRSRPVPVGDLADGDRRVVLLTPAGDGTGRTALHALAAALADGGVHARVVMGPIDAHHLAELCLMAQPAAVVVLSDRPNPDLSLVDGLHAALPDLAVFVAVADDDAAATLPLDRAINRSRTFPGVLHEVMAVTRSSVLP